MENKTLEEADIKALHREGNEKTKKKLETLYGVEFFAPNIMDIIKLFEDACVYLKKDPKKEIDFPNPKNDRERLYNANVIADIIEEALNQGWVKDYNDPNQKKWYPIFTWQNRKGKKPGFGFAYTIYDYSSAGACVGSRHRFKNPELAKYFATQFPDLNNDLLTLKTTRK